MSNYRMAQRGFTEIRQSRISLEQSTPGHEPPDPVILTLPTGLDGQWYRRVPSVSAAVAVFERAFLDRACRCVRDPSEDAQDVNVLDCK